MVTSRSIAEVIPPAVKMHRCAFAFHRIVVMVADADNRTDDTGCRRRCLPCSWNSAGVFIPARSSPGRRHGTSGASRVAGAVEPGRHQSQALERRSNARRRTRDTLGHGDARHRCSRSGRSRCLRCWRRARPPALAHRPALRRLRLTPPVRRASASRGPRNGGQGEVGQLRAATERHARRGRRERIRTWA